MAALAPHRLAVLKRQAAKHYLRARQLWPDDVLKAAAGYVVESAISLPDPQGQDGSEEWEHGLRCAGQLFDPDCYFKQGNLKNALLCLRQRLVGVGLWEHVKRGSVQQESLSPEEYEEIADADWRVIHITRCHVDNDIWKKWDLESKTTASELLNALDIACQPFRLLDLPRELRDKIYKVTMTRPGKRQWGTIANEVECKYIPSSFGGRTAHTWIFRAPVITTWAAVSSQVRAETAELYYKHKRFIFDFNSCVRLEAVQEWVDVAGLEALRHLRNVRVRFNWQSDDATTFSFRYSDKDGLRVQIYEMDGEHGDNEHTDAYLQWIESLPEVKSGRSTGIIEYLTANPEALRRAYWWCPVVDEEEPVNERDAYEVAYGLSPYDTETDGSPW